jgi:hypothetical protein
VQVSWVWNGVFFRLNNCYIRNMSTEKDLKALSDSELDSLIEQGIAGQENSYRHGDDYNHHLNVVAAAKEEKAQRADGGKSKSKDSGKDIGDVAEGIPDKVADMTDNGTQPKSSVGDAGETDHEPITPKPVGDDGLQKDVIPADKVNQGLPGVDPGMAEETPENASQK